MGNMSANDPNTSITHVACDLNLRFVVKSSMLGILAEIGHAVVPAHLVEKLNVGTVAWNNHSKTLPGI